LSDGDSRVAFIGWVHNDMEIRPLVTWTLQGWEWGANRQKEAGVISQCCLKLQRGKGRHQSQLHWPTEQLKRNFC